MPYHRNQRMRLDAPGRTISVREQSATDLNAADWKHLQASRSFWELMDAGIVSVAHVGRAHTVLSTGPFVGQAVIDGILLRIEEKIAGSLPALLRMALHADARVVHATSFIEDNDVALRSLVDEFLNLLDQYIVHGRRKVYVSTRQRSGIPRGKISVEDTMRLWSKGRRDQVIYDLHELSPAVFLNQLIGLALFRLDGLLSGFTADQHRRRRLRTAALLFEDARWHPLAAQSLARLDEQYALWLSAGERFGPLAALARMFALHFGVATTVTEESIPVSWFVNLETLFEDCVRRAIAVAAKEVNLRVTDGRSVWRYVLHRQQRFRTEPDIVIWSGERAVAVVDAKYKSIEAGPSSPDIYQVLAYADSWSVSEVALVYPGDETSHRILGWTADGVRVAQFAVNVRDLLNSARSIVGLTLGTDASTRRAAAPLAS